MHIDCYKAPRRHFGACAESASMAPLNKAGIRSIYSIISNTYNVYLSLCGCCVCIHVNG